MARAKATTLTSEPTDEDGIPDWKQQSVERSLQRARGRAQARSDRFVAATIELMNEGGSTEFTVQDVVDRSRMSIRTFYNFFASKDDLLVAVHQTILAKEVTPRLRKACDRESDPIKRVRLYIEAIYDLTSDVTPVYRALTTYSNRLAETRPQELALAYRPQICLVEELVRDAAASGRLQTRLSVESAAQLLHHTVLSAVHNRILGSEQGGRITAEELWAFCSSGLGVDPTPTKSTR
jgi:AcrR family transcriptional regulator